MWFPGMATPHDPPVTDTNDTSSGTSSLIGLLKGLLSQAQGTGPAGKAQPAVLYDGDGHPIGGVPGQAAPGAALQVGGTDGADLRALGVDTHGSAAARILDPGGVNTLAVNADGSTNSKLTASSATIGVVIPSFSNGSQWQPASAAPDTGATGATIGPVAPWLFNGTTFDSQQNNTQGTLLASAARTANTVSPTMTNYNGQRVTMFLYVSAASGTGGLDVRIIGVDPQNTGQVYALDAPLSTRVTAIGAYVFMLGPGLTSSGPISGSQVEKITSSNLPRTWYAEVTVGDSTSYTYSLSYAAG